VLSEGRALTPEALAPEAILEGPYWPEPVRVIRITPVGDSLRLEGEGLHTHRFYQPILRPDQLAQVRVRPAALRDWAGRPEAVFLALEATRIRYAHQFDPLLVVSSAQIDPLPHQIDAVYHHLLRQPRLRFLLADDPGAGKTIMAGLVLKELKLRGLVERTLIVVPGHLRDQWVRELRERFGETFTVIDRAALDAAWGRNLWEEHAQVLTAMDFAKQAAVLETLRPVSWDLVIVDEAHKLAAWVHGDTVRRTQRYRLGEVLAQQSRFLLLLTATPHRGDPENFRLLLDLLEPGMFSSASLLQASLAARDNPLFLRRLKEDLKDFAGRPLFPPRQVQTLTFRLSDPEKALYNAVTLYVAREYNRALGQARRNVAFALLVLQRRLASSVRAVRRSLERRRQRLVEQLQAGTWRPQEEEAVDPEELDERPEQERLQVEETALATLTAAETREQLRAEIAELERLIAQARRVEQSGVETKLQQLAAVFQQEAIRQSGAKILIFTESRDTLEYLLERIQEWGLTAVGLHGGMNLEERIAAEREFRDRAQVMVSTEAGGEGINLQFCALMVNYDLPWTPYRLEQRMGRIHRYGQTREVHIYNLVAEDTREGAVLAALFRKLEEIRRDMGSDRVFDVISEVLAGTDLYQLIVQAVACQRSLEEIVAEITALPSAEAIRRAREAALESLATRFIDFASILGEEQRAREHRLVPEYIARFFQRACAFLTLPLERRRDGLWRLARVPLDLRTPPPAFLSRYGRVYETYDRIAFDKQTARRLQAECVGPGHPLLEAVVDRVLQQAAPDLARGATFADPDGLWTGWLWVYEVAVSDGTGALAGRRLLAIHQAPDGAVRPVSPALLWDLVAAPTPDTTPPPRPEAVEALACDLAEQYRQALLAERQRTAAVRRKYGVASLEILIAESDAKLADYLARQARGDPLPEVTIRNEARRLEELRAKKAALERRIAAEQALTFEAPRLVGVVRIVPAAVTVDGVGPPDPAVEAAGMAVAMAYERAAGREPVDVSAENLGYDIRSVEPDGTVRHIEVKAHRTTGPVALTPNEWTMASRLGADYWLYVVEHALTTPHLTPIQDPAARLPAEEVVEVVRYVVRDWRVVAPVPVTSDSASGGGNSR
jgi:superfamily II DNA or RNA helicase